MTAILPTLTIRQLPRLHIFRPTPPPPSLHRRRISISSFSSSIEQFEEKPNSNPLTISKTEPNNNRSNNRKIKQFFPKRGETLELVCESLGFKGKGVCKVEETGYVVMCDRALPGERFIGRVTKKKNNYSEVCYLLNYCYFCSYFVYVMYIIKLTGLFRLNVVDRIWIMYYTFLLCKYRFGFDSSLTIVVHFDELYNFHSHF